VTGKPVTNPAVVAFGHQHLRGTPLITTWIVEVMDDVFSIIGGTVESHVAEALPLRYPSKITLHSLLHLEYNR
jgi:hypothetical protein